MATVRPDFINVDLSVASRANLEPLVGALARHTLLLASYRLRGRHHVRFELNRQTRSRESAPSRNWFVPCLRQHGGYGTVHAVATLILASGYLAAETRRP